MIKRVLRAAAGLEIRLPKSKEAGRTKRGRMAAIRMNWLLSFLLPPTLIVFLLQLYEKLMLVALRAVSFCLHILTAGGNV